MGEYRDKEECAVGLGSSGFISTRSAVGNFIWFPFSMEFYHKSVLLKKSEKVNGRHVICLEKT